MNLEDLIKKYESWKAYASDEIESAYVTLFLRISKVWKKLYRGINCKPWRGSVTMSNLQISLKNMTACALNTVLRKIFYFSRGGKSGYFGV